MTTSDASPVVLLVDHYGWRETDSGDVVRALSQDEIIKASATAGGLAYEAIDIAVHAGGAAETHLRIGRVPSPTVWEALATTVIRQVVRAQTARRNYWRLIDFVGNGPSFPTPVEVQDVGAEAAASLGLAFAWPKLNALATWALDEDAHRPRSKDDSVRLIDDASRIPGIGPWSVAVARYDVTCDASHYPAGDYVMQLGASRLFGDQGAPRAPDEFGPWWRTFTNGDGVCSALALAAADDRGWESIQELMSSF